MFLGASYLEWSAVIMTAICIFLAGRNNIHTWWTGIVACVLYGALFYKNQLYADVTLQGFFVITGFIGWYNWASMKKVRTDGYVAFTDRSERPITHTDWSVLAVGAGVAFAVAIAYGMMLKAYTDAFAPMIDSLVLTLSVLAQVLLMRRKVENWSVWIIVNTLAVPLFFSRELYLSSFMYALFLVNAVVSWKHWLNLKDKQA